MSWIIVGPKVPRHITPAGEGRSPEFLDHADITNYGIAHLGGLRGKSRLVECAAQKRSRRHLDVLRPGALLHTKEKKWNYREKLIALHRSPPEGGPDSGSHTA